jgi:phosphatidylserine decarboxylase
MVQVVDNFLSKSKGLLIYPAMIAGVGLATKRDQEGFIIAICIILLIFYISRDEDLPTSAQASEFVSPAHGILSEIREESGAKTIVIVQGITDIHTQYNPIECYISGSTKYKGKSYLLPSDDIEKSSFYEYKCVGKIPFAIRSYQSLSGKYFSRVKKYTSVNQQEIIGRNEFGGQINITVPSSVKIIPQIGEIIQGGKTVLFEV